MSHLLQTEELRRLTSRPPAKASAELFLVRLDAFPTYLVPGPDTEAALRDVRNHVSKYVAAHSRERWRKPPPALWQRCVAAARRAAEAWEEESRSPAAERDEGVDATRPSPPRLVPRPSPLTYDRDDSDRGQQGSQLADDAPPGWAGGHVATVRVSASEVPLAVVRSQVQRSLIEHELGDAEVLDSQDELRVWWEPDEEERWERNLLEAVVGDAVVEAGLPRSVVRVRWVA